MLTRDVGAGLPRLLEHGVPTGVVNIIPRSGAWREVEEHWTALVLDVSKARKRVKVHRSVQGLLLFTVIDESGRAHLWLHMTVISAARGRPSGGCVLRQG